MKTFFIGLDVSKETTSVCVLSKEGSLIFEDSVVSHPKYINMCLGARDISPNNVGLILLESGTWSRWITIGLKEFGWSVLCIDAWRLARLLSLTSNKTDKNDARGIAEAARTQTQSRFFKVLSHKSDEAVAIKHLLTARQHLLNQQIKLSNIIRGLLNNSHIQVKIRRSTIIKDAEGIIKDMSAHSAKALGVLLETYRILTLQYSSMDKYVKKMAVNDDVCKRLMTIPGIGPLTALTYRVEIDDPERFSKARSVAAYLGLTPKVYQSGTINRKKGITKRGSSRLRCLLSEAALVILTRIKSENKLKSWGLKLQERLGFSKARVALARKLAVLMLFVWLNGSTYQD